jgi:hypothetical protein
MAEAVVEEETAATLLPETAGVAVAVALVVAAGLLEKAGGTVLKTVGATAAVLGVAVGERHRLAA